MMSDHEIEIVQALVDALDGTCLHEWDLAAGAARGGIIAEAPNGRRFSISIEARELAAPRPKPQHAAEAIGRAADGLPERRRATQHKRSDP